MTTNIAPSSAGGSNKERGRRQSQSTLAAMDVPRSRCSPAAIVSAVFKHGKYVAFGAGMIWYLDLGNVVHRLLESKDGWGRPALLAHFGLQFVTIVSFLYLTLFLPWFRGYLPNYPKWQQSRRLRVIVPVLTTSILLGWTALVIALRSAGHGPTGGAIRDAIRDALNVEAQPHFGSLSAMAGVYTVVFGLLGFIPQPNVPVRVKKQQ